MGTSLAHRSFGTLARLLGLAALLLALVAPGMVRAKAPTGTNQRLTSPGSPSGSAPRSALSSSVDEPRFEADELEGGACGDDEEVSDKRAERDEWVDCGADLPPFEQHGLLALVRASLERISPDQCKVLLDELYARQICRVQDRDCGKLVRFAPLPTNPLVVSGSASGRVVIERLVIAAASSLELARAGNDRPPFDRALAPPDRPPRTLVHG